MYSIGSACMHRMQQKSITKLKKHDEFVFCISQNEGREGLDTRQLFRTELEYKICNLG